MDALTVPEMDRLVRGRRQARHFEAMRLRWFAVFMCEAMRRAVQNGYLGAKAAMARGRVDHERHDLFAQLDQIPGYDKKLVKAGGRSR